MNKKGFTLIEVIAAIAIMFLLMSLILSNMTSIDKDVRQKDYENLRKEILLAAEDYANTQGSVLNEIFTTINEVETGVSCTCNTSKPNVTIKVLLNKGYIRGNDKTKETINDPRNKESMMEKYVVFCHTGDLLKSELCPLDD